MKRHPLDVFSLVAGALFLTLGVFFVADQFDVDLWRGQGWIPAALLLCLGLFGIVQHGRSLVRARSVVMEPAEQTAS